MADITKHEGSKYLKRIVSPLQDHKGNRIGVNVDVYAVLEAFGVTCPAIAHCVKKLLMPGQRGKGDKMADLKGAMAALNRAIELEEDRTGKVKVDPVDLKVGEPNRTCTDPLSEILGPVDGPPPPPPPLPQDWAPPIPVEELAEQARSMGSETAKLLDDMSKPKPLDPEKYPNPPEQGD